MNSLSRLLNILKRGTKHRRELCRGSRRRLEAGTQVELLEQRALLTPVVNFDVDTVSASEADMTTVTLTVSTSEPVIGDQTVDVTVSGSRVTADDYLLSDAQITIHDSQTTGTATFTAQDDSLFEGTEVARITISNPSAGITIGADNSRTVSIANNGMLNDAIDNVLNQTTARQTQGMQAQLADTFPVSNPMWFHENFALAAYWLNQQTADADAGLISLIDDGHYQADVDADHFHWNAYLLERIYFLFSSRSDIPEFQGRMSEAAENAVLEMLWDWSAPITQVGMASFDKINFYWESENHDAQAWVSFWGAAQIFEDHPDYQNRTYADGSTPAEMAAAFDDYFKAYVRRYTLKGLPLEIASPTYAKYTLNTWYNLYDFADDPELKEAAGGLLDVYWADWAMEQLDGVRGGSRHRSYAGRTSISQSSAEGHAWYVLGQGTPASKHPGDMSGATTFWRPSRAVVGLTLDVTGRGSFEYTSRRLGLKDQTPGPEPPNTGHSQYNPIDPDGGSLLRYTWTTPDFVMGMTQVEARPWEDWTAVSSQNRWNGVTFGGHDTARIFTQRPYPGNNRSVYNEEWGVQHKGAMILQRLSQARSATGQMIWFDFALNREELNGWIFAEAPGAFAAVRVVHGGWTWQPDSLEQHRTGTNLTVGEWAVLNEEFSPIILEVARKEDYEDFDSFKAEILANTVSWDGTRLDYSSTGYNTTLTHFANESGPPQIDGTPLNFTPTEVYDSPYLQGDFGNGVAIIDYGDDRTVHGVSPFADDANTIGLWHFDEALAGAAGTFYTDDTAVTSRTALEAREHTASMDSISVITDGMFGNALRFDFSEGDQYMITPSELWPADEGTFRFQGWFRLNPGDAGGFLAHVYDQVYLSVNGSTATFSVNKTGNTADTNPANLVTVSADINTSNEWQYIDAIYNGATIQLLTEIETVAASGIGPFVPDRRNIYIGSRKNRSNFVGDLDEVKLSAPDKVITADLSVATADRQFDLRQGNEAGTSIVFTVTLSETNDSGSPIAFNLDDLLTGTATSGGDYVAIPPDAQVSVPDGADQGTISIQVIDDLLIEATETMTARISTNDSSVLITKSTATATIQDNDTAGITIASANGIGGIVLLDDDLSTFDQLSNHTHSTVSWTTNGTDAIYENGTGSHRASLRSNDIFDFNPNGEPYHSVTLEFTGKISQSTTGDRFEIGFWDQSEINFVNNNIAAESITAAVVRLTNEDGSPGLVFDDNAGPETVAVPMTENLGTHTYKIIFTTTGTELFRDGILIGGTTEALDFTKDYRFNAYSQSSTDAELHHVTITAATEGVSVGETGATDSYTIALDTIPTGPVEITATTDEQTLLSLDGVNFSPMQVLSFSDTTPQTVTVKAIADSMIEGEHSAIISHAVTGTVYDPNYPNVTIEDLYSQTGTDPTFQELIDSGTLPTDFNSTIGVTGSAIDVNNAAIEQGVNGSNPIRQDLRIHTVGNSSISRSNFDRWSRWYQEDGNTQVFRLFEGEENVRNDRQLAARIESWWPGWQVGLWHDFSATYTIIKPHQMTLFQSFQTGVEWSVHLNMNDDGDVSFTHRRVDGSQLEIPLARDMIGKSFDLLIRENGLDYEVYFNGELKGVGQYDRPDPEFTFRWGMYRGSHVMTHEALVFVTGATITENTSAPTGLEPYRPATTALTVADVAVVIEDTPPSPDLIATAFDAVSDHLERGQTDVTFTIANTGHASAAAFDTHIVWSPNDILGDFDDIIVSGSTTSFTGLAAGATESRTINIQIDRAALYAHAMASDQPGLPSGTASIDSSRLFLVVDTKDDVVETDETNNSGLGHQVDSDDVTSFVWDIDHNGVITPREALYGISKIGTADPDADLNGDGIATPLEALARLQRLTYRLNASVIESALESFIAPVSTPAFVAKDDERGSSLFATPESDETPQLSAGDDSQIPADTAFETTKWLDVI